MKKVVVFCSVLFTLFTLYSCIKEDDLTSPDSYIKIQQDDLQDWDFGIASEKNNVVLVKENDIDGLSHVLFLLYRTEDTISLKFQSDTLTDFYYNGYHFMVSSMDSLLLFTTIDGNMAMSYTIPYYEQVVKCNSKGIASTLLESAVKIINKIFDAESGIEMLREIESGDRESLMHDMGEFLAEQGFGRLPYGSFGVLSYELYKHYLDRLHNKAIQFHIGNASCMIQNIQRNKTENTIEVTVSVINGEDVPNEYIWKNYWGQQVSSPNYVYYGVLCRAGNFFPTLQKHDYYQKVLLDPHTSLTHTFSFPASTTGKVLFRSFLGFNYDYHNTAMQNGYNKVSLAKYGNVVEFNVPSIELDHYIIEDNPQYTNGAVNFEISVFLKGDENGLTDFSEYGFYIKYANDIDYHRVDHLSSVFETTQVDIDYYIEREGFFSLDYNNYVATATDYYIGVYTVKNGEIDMFDEQPLEGLTYTQPPTITFTNVNVGATSVTETDDDGNATRYHTAYSFNYLANGSFWYETIQYTFNNEHWNNYWDSQSIYEDNNYSATGWIEYGNNTEMSHTCFYTIYLRNGNTIYSTNSLVVGGVPGNPTITIGGAPSNNSLIKNSHNSDAINSPRICNP